jgi:hypothetical protein
MAKITIDGEKPYRYADERIGELKERVFINYYRLVTGDSFEYGEAYSLHAKEEDAEDFLPDSWWSFSHGPEEVFVSKKTLEKIVKSEENGILIGWEN